MALIKWVITDSSKYAALGTKEDNALYFLSDTQEIYKGSVSYTQPTVFYDGEKPAVGALGKVYINSTTLEGSVYGASGWKTVIQPIATTLNASDTTAPVSGKAVADYVTGRITNVAGDFVTEVGYNADTHSITYTKGGETESVQITKFVSGVSYDNTTGVLSFTDAAGNKVGTDINLPLESFVSEGYYDDEAEALVLVVKDVAGTETEVSIPAADLIKIYEAGSTNSATVSIANSAEGNTITVDVKVSAAAGNTLEVKDDGLYVAVPDTSGKADKVDASAAGQILVASDEGNLEASGKKIGGATLATTTDANTLATEAAVAAVKAAIEQAAETAYVKKANIATEIGTAAAASDDKVASQKAVATAIETVNTEVAKKANKVTGATEDTVFVASADGDLKSTTKTFGGATLAETASADTLATEAAVAAALTWTVLP